MGNVVILPVISRLDLDPEILLDAARGELANVIIIGFTHDGDEYFASSQGDGAQVLWQLERAKHKLLNVVDDMSN